MAEVHGLSVKRRLALCRDLLELEEKRSGAPEASRINATVMARRRAASIRKVLLGRDGVGLADELLSPAVMTEKILATLEALKDAPQHERDAAVVYAQAITETLQILANAEKRYGLSGLAEGVASLKAELSKAGFDSYQMDFKDAYIDACVERGKIVDEETKEALDAAANGGTEADYAVDEATRQLAARYAEIVAEWQRLREAVIAVAKEHGYDSQQYKDARAAWDAFDEQLYTPAHKAEYDVRIEPTLRAKASFAKAGEKVISKMLAASPISEDEATAWANAQEVTPAARGRLKKLGYPLDQLRRDMAEFYRFTGGRLARVRIHSKGDRRANATDIEEHGKVGTINLATSFDKRVLWHELAHHMEADPVAKLASGRFIRRRALDEGTVYSLRSLTGNSGYRRDEGAYKDHFFDHYVGKVYRNGITEVFSMAVESFSSPELLARRLAVDPQTLEFAAGFVRRPMDPLARAHMGLRQIALEIVETAEEAHEEAVEEIVTKLADEVAFEATDDISWAGSYYWMLNHFGKQVGRMTGKSGTVAHLFAGKVRDNNTGRKVNGLVVVWSAANGETSYTQMPTRDQAYARAALAIYVRTGLRPSWAQLSNPAYLRGHA